MDKDKLADAIGNIDDSIIEEADAARTAPRKIRLPSHRPIAAAAVVVAALALSLITVKFLTDDRFVSGDEALNEGTAEVAGAAIAPSTSAGNGTPSDTLHHVPADDAIDGGQESLPETVPEIAVPDAEEEFGTMTESFAGIRDVTVTVDHESFNHSSGVPTVTIDGNEAAAEKINKNEALADVIRQSISFDGTSEGAVTYIKTSPASLTVGYYVYSYSPGAMHPIHFVKYFNFSLDSGELLDVADVLDKNNPDAADILRSAVAAALINEQSKFTDGTVFDRTADEIAAEFVSGQAHDKWYLTEDSLRIIYSPYDIAHYAAGYISAVIPYEDITGVIDERFIPISDTNGSIQIRESLDTAPWLITKGTVSHLTVRAGVYEWDSQVIVYYRSRVENEERINLGSYQNYWFTYNHSDSLEYVPYENVPGNP